MDEITRLLREERPKSSAGRVIPANAPDGWTHLSVATARIAHAIIRDNEGGLLGAYWFALHLEDADGLSDDPDVGAYLRDAGELVAGFVSRSCYEGHLVTGFRKIGGGGEPALLRREWWNGFEDPFGPFRTWGYDPEDPAHPDPANWIWVREDSLITQEARLLHLGDATKALPEMDFGNGGPFEAITMVRALAIIGASLPAGLDGHGARVAWLSNSCATGAVKSLAGHMYRSIKADENGLGGSVVESVPTWLIESRLWASLSHPVHQDWRGGEIIALDGPDTYRLTGVHIDRASLMRTLCKLGLVREVPGPEAAVWAALFNDGCWIGYAPARWGKLFRPLEPGSAQQIGEAPPPSRAEALNPAADPLANEADGIKTKPVQQWQMRDGPEYRYLLNILQSAKAREMFRGGREYRSLEWLHERYKALCQKPKDKEGNPLPPVKPLGFSAFKKWAKLFNQGDWGI